MSNFLFTPISTCRNYQVKRYKTVLLAFFLCCLSFSGFSNVTITTATGGTNICSNTAVTGSSPDSTTLGPIIVSENLQGDFTGGPGATSFDDTLRLVPPAGWRFCLTMPGLSYTMGMNITAITGSITSGALTVIISVNKNNKYDDFTITGLQVQPLTTAASTGDIYASTAYNIAGVSTGIGGTGFGTLSLTPQPIGGFAPLCVGDSITLTDATAGGTWQSDATGIAAVGTGGVTVGVSAGTANISYTVAGCVTTSPITVNPPPVISGNMNVCITATTLLTGAPAGGTWTSLNLFAVLINSATGLATGNNIGSSVIRYTLSPGCISTTTVTVHNPPGPVVGSHYACMGEGITLTDPTDPGGTWTSSNPAMVTIGSATGIMSGVVFPGTATITYSVGASCNSTYIVTTSPTPAVIVGTHDVCQTLTITLTDATPLGTWSSTFPTVASVSPTGVVTGIAPSGSTQILYTLTATGCYNTPGFFVTVHIPPAPITGTDSMCQSDNVVLSDGIGGGTWSSSSTAVATISAGGPACAVYGVAGGTSIISYVIPGCPIATYPVKVNPTPHTITGLASICIGFATSLTDSTAGGTWSISDGTIASIDPITGAITDLDTVIGHSATITYTLPTSCYTTLPLTVNFGPKPITGPDSVCQGAQMTLADSVAGGTWSSTDLSLAQVIDTSGVVSGIHGGTATISYTLGDGCYASIPLKIVFPTPATVTASVSPGTRVCEGTPLTFSASTTNAGTPTYQWQVFFGGIPGATSSTWTYAPHHGDVIIVQAVTHGVCATQDTVYDTVAANVDPIVTPVVSITKLAMPDTVAYAGQVFTFYSDVVGGGTHPSYQWYVNRTLIVGATMPTLAAAVYANDTFFLSVTGNAPCEGPGAAYSNGITIYAAYLDVHSLSAAGNAISLFPNPNNGTLTLTGTVDAAAGNNNVTIEVSDLLGHVVYNGAAVPQNGSIHEQITLDNSLPAGAYLLHATSETVNEVFHFVISK